jgi:FMN reductase
MNSSPRPRILVVSGSTQHRSRTRSLCDLAAESLSQAGAEARLIDLHETRLPLFEVGSAAQAELPEVQVVRESARWAHGFILGTPEYHGAIGGALKNWLDYLYDELSGKLSAIMSVSGGSYGGDLSTTATQNSVHWCHGFTLPFHVTARPQDFRDGELVDGRVRERVGRLVHDVIRYAPVLYAAFLQACELGQVVEAGFAGFHAVAIAD